MEKLKEFVTVLEDISAVTTQKEEVRHIFIFEVSFLFLTLVFLEYLENLRIG